MLKSENLRAEDQFAAIPLKQEQLVESNRRRTHRQHMKVVIAAAKLLEKSNK
ncbi:MAG: hypothetical protein O7G83_09850 [Proteobacteria bacterium]|nr:hypothetical protein [Pseudomonadota bacterium]